MGTEDETTSTSSLGGSLGVAYTPVTFAESKIPVRISGLAGVMLMSTTVEAQHKTFTAMGSDETTDTKREAKVLGFVGLSATAYITKHFGVVGYGKLTTDPKYSQIGLSAAWLL